MMKRGEKRIATSCEDMEKNSVPCPEELPKDATSLRHVPHKKTEG
jgi:hypothetical protein